MSVTSFRSWHAFHSMMFMCCLVPLPFRDRTLKSCLRVITRIHAYIVLHLHPLLFSCSEIHTIYSNSTNQTQNHNFVLFRLASVRSSSGTWRGRSTPTGGCLTKGADEQISLFLGFFLVTPDVECCCFLLSLVTSM